MDEYSHENGCKIDRVGKALDNGSILDDDNVSSVKCQSPLINAHFQFSFNADNGSSKGKSERERKLGRKRIVVANINGLSYSCADSVPDIGKSLRNRFREGIPAFALLFSHGQSSMCADLLTVTLQL